MSMFQLSIDNSWRCKEIKIASSKEAQNSDPLLGLSGISRSVPHFQFFSRLARAMWYLYGVFERCASFHTIFRYSPLQISRNLKIQHDVNKHRYQRSVPAILTCSSPMMRNKCRGISLLLTWSVSRTSEVIITLLRFYFRNYGLITWL